MKYNLFLTLTMTLLLLSNSPANAALITGGADGTGAGIGGGLSSGVTIPLGSETGGLYTGVTFAGNPNQVSFILDVLRLDSPFVVNFDVNDGINSDFTEYAFTVTVNNMLLSGKEINGFDIELLVPSGELGVSFDIVTPVPVATGGAFPLAFESPNVSGTNIRFGGLSGGGGGIPIMTSQDLQFSVRLTDFGDISANGNTFGLRFTANPEPEAIFLGSFTLAIGGFFVYRRRKQQLELQTETEAV